jgi:hypothetical protein
MQKLEINKVCAVLALLTVEIRPKIAIGVANLNLKVCMKMLNEEMNVN